MLIFQRGKVCEVVDGNIFIYRIDFKNYYTNRKSRNGIIMIVAKNRKNR